MSFARLLPLALIASAVLLEADPLSKRVEIDFFRDVPSRNLKGLATRSDGRLVAGPTLAEIAAPAPADILWCIEPAGTPNTFLVGSGPDGRILELTFDLESATYAARDVVKLDDPQIFTLKRLPDGTILAGTSPKGALYLIRDGKAIARALLPVDSIFDLLVIDDTTVLAATGNPGRIYRIDVRKFATVGLIADKITDAKILADRGISVFGEIRDRNVRRLAAFPDGRIAAGSAPRGNLYTFPAEGGSPVILQENRDAEVTDLLPEPDGDLYATIVYSGSSGDARIGPPARPAAARDRDDAPPPPVQVDRFGGRSALVWFPAQGFAETLASRSGAAFYRMIRHEDTLVIAGGDTGELLGYDLKSRLSLTFAGSISAQLNGVVPLPGNRGRFLLLRNNAPGLAVLDFQARGPREAETRRIDLNTPARLGAFRVNRLRDLSPADLAIEARVNHGSDEIEGWGPWTALELQPDGGWRADDLRGRNAKFRLRVPAAERLDPAVDQPRGFEIDRVALFVLPQNRRPQLQEFRVLSPGFGLIPAVEPPPSPVVSINQLLQGANRDEDRRKGFGSSQVVPQPGAQVVLWNVTDPDGDNVTCTYSIRRDGEERWIDVLANTRDSFAQFDTSHLPDGVYFTRLVASETAPRPERERLSHTFETDDLVIDHTAPEISAATAQHGDGVLRITVAGHDALSLLHGIELAFNNGAREQLEQPADGIRDGRAETFSLDVPLARVANATAVEVTLYDAAGNSTARRLTW